MTQQQKLSKEQSGQCKRGPQRTPAPLSARSSDHPSSPLQQTVGNHGVLSRCGLGLVQAKLNAGQPGDACEQEADHVAAAVLRTPGPTVPGRPAVSGAIRHAQASPGQELPVGPQVQAQIGAMQGQGHPLPDAVRAFFEPRLGHDLGHVRIHTDALAAEAARALQAQAFTVGRDLVFAAGQYAPETGPGQRLLAHELVHVLQNRDLGQAPLRRQQAQTKESRKAELAGVMLMTDYVSPEAVKKDSTDRLTDLQKMVQQAMENCFEVCGGPDYVTLQQRREIIETELESRSAEQVHKDFKAAVSVSKTTWKPKLKQELASQGAKDVEDWALDAIGNFVGLPYASAHQFYGGADTWRQAYKQTGVYPAAVVCDQLGELTQRLARGVEYGFGLRGHYAFYQANDARFPAAPAATSDARCAPGATLFSVTEKKWDFRQEAIDGAGKLINNGVPQKGVDLSDVFAISGRAPDLARLLRIWKGKGAKAQASDLEKPLKDLTTKYKKGEWANDLASLATSIKGASPEEVEKNLNAFAEQYYKLWQATLENAFEADKTITHEYSLLAVAKSGTGEDRLLFLDTWGPAGAGTAQVRTSTLAKEATHDWGYVAGVSTRRIPIVSPYSQVTLKVQGTYKVFSFDDIWMESPVPPPIVFKYALESVRAAADLSVWLEFYAVVEWQKEKVTKVVRELALQKGKAQWRKPAEIPSK